jgi:hypothetical protein
MQLTTFDILVKPADFAERAERLALPRWKWDVLDAIDGSRSIGAIATILGIDDETIVSFADECISAEVIELATLGYAEYFGGRGAEQPQPQAQLLVAPRATRPTPTTSLPEPPDLQAQTLADDVTAPVEHAPVTDVPVAHVAAAQAPVVEPARASSRPATLQERVAALKARALNAIAEAKEQPREGAAVADDPSGAVEFSLASTPQVIAEPSADAIEFSL